MSDHRPSVANEDDGGDTSHHNAHRTYLSVREAYGIRETAVFREDRLSAFYVDTLGISATEGDVFCARVAHTHQQLGAVFLDLGGGEQGFLTESGARFADRTALPSMALSGAPTVTPTETPQDTSQSVDSSATPGRGAEKLSARLPVGTMLLVQIDREASGEKVARATTRIRLQGRHLVLSPLEPGVNLSKSVRRESTLDHLSEITEALTSALTTDAGIIVRTSAVRAQISDLADEVRRLEQMWHRIDPSARLSRDRKPGLLIKGNDGLTTALLSQSDPPRAVFVSPRRSAVEVKEKLLSLFPDFDTAGDLVIQDAARHAHTADSDAGRDAVAAMDLDEIAGSLTAHRMTLPSGARVQIQATEVGVTIDVDRGSATQSNEGVNQEAARDIGRHIHLRHLAGRIIVDFIDLQSRKHASELMNLIRERIADEASALEMTFDGMTGLVLIKRRKTRRSVQEELDADCESCAGTGHRRSLPITLRTALLSLEQQTTRGRNPPTLRLHPDTLRQIRMLYPALLREAATQLGQEVAFQEDTQTARGDITLETTGRE